MNPKTSAAPQDMGFERRVIVTEFGVIPLCADTLKAMNATYPGWCDPPLRGRTKAIKAYNERAKRGADALVRAVNAIAQLAWEAEQEFLQA